MGEGQGVAITYGIIGVSQLLGGHVPGIPPTPMVIGNFRELVRTNPVLINGEFLILYESDE